jgi:uncharacterized protein
MTQTTSSSVDAALIKEVSAYVKQYMSQYDASHDYNHILRVLGLAKRLCKISPEVIYNPTIVTLSALLHDVGDRKYVKPGEDASTMVEKYLLSIGVDAKMASTIQTIASAVSYTSEMKDPEKVKELIKQYPELAVVQDADRIDAIGAVGIGRVFTYGGAMHEGSPDTTGSAGLKAVSSKGRGMDDTMAHFDVKLMKVEAVMKTSAGKDLARERTQRLSTFKTWWLEEAGSAVDGLTILGE